MMKEHRKKILLSINTSWNVFNFRLNLICFFKKHGFEVVVVSPEDEYSVRIIEAGIKYYPIKMQNKGTNPFKDVNLIAQYKDVFQLEKPDLILLYTIKPNIFGSLAASELGIPVINNITGLGTAFIRKNWINWVVRKLYNFSLKKSKVVFFQNTDDRALFVDQKLVAFKATRIIAGSGVDVNRFSVRSLPQKRSVLFIGRLLYDKGIVELLHAAEIIHEKYRGLLTVKVLGKFETEANLGVSEELIEFYNARGIIDYLGTTDQVEDEIEMSSAVILPSYREGTSRSLLEAASMGRPILASNVPGCNNVVEHNINGWLFRPRSIEALVSVFEKLIHVSDDELFEKGQNSRSIVEQRFGESFVFNSYLNEIAKII